MKYSVVEKKNRTNWNRKHSLHHLVTHSPCLGMISKPTLEDQWTARDVSVCLGIWRMSGIWVCFDFNLPFPHYNFVTYCQPKNICSVASVLSLQKGKHWYFHRDGQMAKTHEIKWGCGGSGRGDSWGKSHSLNNPVSQYFNTHCKAWSRC